MSKSTIVSVCPFQIGPEHKPQLSPSTYLVNEAPLDDFSVTIIEDAIQYIPQLDHKTLVQPVLSFDLAKAIVNDWVSAQLQTQLPDAAPGLFCLDGEYDKSEIEDDFAAELELAKNRHTAWAQNLLNMADDIWAVSPRFRHISDSMRFAAKYLKVDRQWLRKPRPEELKKCPACTSNIPSDAIVCFTCRTVLDRTRYKELNFAEVV